jgi:hypothetical protein
MVARPYEHLWQQVSGPARKARRDAPHGRTPAIYLIQEAADQETNRRKLTGLVGDSRKNGVCKVLS